MTKRDFFILFLKVFGLYSFLIFITSFISNYLYLFASDDILSKINFDSITWLLGPSLFLLPFCAFLIFLPNVFINFFKLDKGFDNDYIEVGRLCADDVLKIAIFVIGGILLVENIPDFLSNTFLWIFKASLNITINQEYKLAWGVNGFKVVIAMILLTRYHIIANIIKPK